MVCSNNRQLPLAHDVAESNFNSLLAIHIGPESCVTARKGRSEPLTGVRAGRVLSREIHAPRRKQRALRGADAVEISGRPHPRRRSGKTPKDPARSETPSMLRKHFAWEPGGPACVCASPGRPHREVQGRTPMTNGRRKSDRSVVPQKPPNKAGTSAAEAVEARGLAKGNSPECNAFRTQRRGDAPSALERVREATRGLGRHHPRQEPDAVMPHVRIRGGGNQRWSFLLRLLR